MLAPGPVLLGDPRRYSEVGLDASDTVTLETLGGGLARDSPALYRVPTGVTDGSS